MAKDKEEPREDRERSRAKIIIDELESGVFTEDELAEIQRPLDRAAEEA
jgi:hypothetical protein